jgi:hypothetical protein
VLKATQQKTQQRKKQEVDQTLHRSAMTRGQCIARVLALFVVAATAWLLVFADQKTDQVVGDDDPPSWFLAIFLAPLIPMALCFSIYFLADALSTVILWIDGVTITTPDIVSQNVIEVFESDGTRWADVEFSYAYNGKQYTSALSTRQERLLQQQPSPRPDIPYNNGVLLGDVKLRLHPRYPELCLLEGEPCPGFQVLLAIILSVFLAFITEAFVEICVDGWRSALDIMVSSGPRFVLVRLYILDGFLAVALIASIMSTTMGHNMYFRACILAKLLLWTDSTSRDAADGKDGAATNDNPWRLHDMATEHTPLTAEVYTTLVE